MDLGEMYMVEVDVGSVGDALFLRSTGDFIGQSRCSMHRSAPQRGQHCGSRIGSHPPAAISRSSDSKDPDLSCLCLGRTTQGVIDDWALAATAVIEELGGSEAVHFQMHRRPRFST